MDAIVRLLMVRSQTDVSEGEALGEVREEKIGAKRGIRVGFQVGQSEKIPEQCV